MTNHELSTLIKNGFIPITLMTFTKVTHVHFRNIGIKHNINYENLCAYRIKTKNDDSESWMVFLDTNKPILAFKDEALLP